MRAQTMNAETSAEHLNQILARYPEDPILLFWDRAPWHQGPAITEIQKQNPRLRIMKFPVAAPELNPQETVWKATRQAVSHNHLIPRLPQLADEFAKHLETTTFKSSLLEVSGFNAIRSMFK